jgi:hypothetical protein
MSLDDLVESYFGRPSPSPLKELQELYEQVAAELLAEVDGSSINEATEKRFSMSIPIPRLVPSEAWGDPDSQDRKEIDRVFRSITGGQDLKARIDSINKFLDASSAKKKRSTSLIINMMMIVEALQATLNDYNDSASGFVFEGFMAALTGGKQIAGKVAGTLPIEDFVAFSSFGADVPVSLKLLSPKTGIKGSFTNIVDFLLVRGKPSIKYLVAYKLTKGDTVEKINIFAFDITIDNFVDFITRSQGDNLLSPLSSRYVKSAMKRFAADPENQLPEIASVITRLNGYSKKGLLHKYVKTGELPKQKSPEEEAEEEEKRYAQRQKDYSRVAGAQAELSQLQESIERGEIEATLAEAFHYIEKQTLLAEASESQWEASFPQIERMASVINLESYGEIDLSQKKIDELIQIYTEKLEGGLMTLLEKAKALTENVGTYYSDKKRSKAQAAAGKAIGDASEIQDVLEGDPRYS